MEIRLLFWMSDCLATWCQDTLVDESSFSHTRVTVSPSKMISGMTENLVSSGNPQKRIIEIPQQTKVTDATHPTSPAQGFSGHPRVSPCWIRGHSFLFGIFAHVRVPNGS